jgi:hypothetical protein
MIELQGHKIGQHLHKNGKLLTFSNLHRYIFADQVRPYLGLSLPLLKSTTSRMPVRRTMATQNLKVSRDNIRQAIERLMEALSAGVDKLELQLVNDLCLSLTSSLFLKSLLSNTGIFLTNETATLSAYYLGMYYWPMSQYH